MPLASLASDAQLQRYMSVYGITTWADHDQDLVDDAFVVEDCKTYGTHEIASRLAQRYAASALASVPILVEIACVVILRELTLRRGNPPPASLEQRYQEIVGKDGWLDQVAGGRVLLLDEDGNPIPAATFNVPYHSNLQVDRRFSEKRIRVVTGQSNLAPSKLRRDFDRSTEIDHW